MPEHMYVREWQQRFHSTSLEVRRGRDNKSPWWTLTPEREQERGEERAGMI